MKTIEQIEDSIADLEKKLQLWESEDHRGYILAMIEGLEWALSNHDKFKISVEQNSITKLKKKTYKNAGRWYAMELILDTNSDLEPDNDDFGGFEL